MNIFNFFKFHGDISNPLGIYHSLIQKYGAVILKYLDSCMDNKSCNNKGYYRINNNRKSKTNTYKCYQHPQRYKNITPRMHRVGYKNLTIKLYPCSIFKNTDEHINN